VLSSKNRNRKSVLLSRELNDGQNFSSLAITAAAAAVVVVVVVGVLIYAIPLNKKGGKEGRLQDLEIQRHHR
jgi:hypothetical protein